MPDISALCQFHFYEPIYFAENNTFPSTRDRPGRFVGIADTVGDALTYIILTDDTQEIIYRSAVRSALTDSECNLRLDPSGGEEKPINVLTTMDEKIGGYNDQEGVNARTYSPEDLIGKTYTKDTDADGNKMKAKVVSLITELNERNKERKRFLIRIDEAKADEIISYDELCDHIEKEESKKDIQNEDLYWQFKEITGHYGPLTKHSPNYKGSSWNVSILWEDNSTTIEPLDTIATDEPVVAALYAKQNGLLNVPGW